jgi:hypothetical protein
LTAGVSQTCPVVHKDRQVVNLFADAAGSPPCIAGVIFGHEKVFAYSEVLPEDILRTFEWRDDDQNIGREMLAILVSLVTFASVVKGRLVRVWTDNVGAECSLRKGSAKCADHHRIVFGIYWFAAMLDCKLWFERVGSKDNIADEPSRNEFRGLQYFGAELVDAVLPAQLRDSSSWASGQLAFEK